MARELVALLGGLGHRVWPVERFRADRPTLPPPSTHLQQARSARAQARRIVARWQALPARHPHRFELWLSYHLYYKKPDWIGPLVAAALGIPYVVVEASHAPKRSHSIWRVGHRMTEAALRCADLVLTLNPNDAACVRPLLRSARVLQALPPFIDTLPLTLARAERATHRARLDRDFGLDSATPLLLTVAMMRRPDKFESYRLLAAALARLSDRPWQLLIVGDGVCRDEVEALFAPFGSRVRFTGALPPTALPAIYAAADLYVWPAVNEAYGMTLLEAQAAGLAVVAGRTGGVPAVVSDGVSGLLPAIGDVEAFAAAVAWLLDRPTELARLRQAAPGYVQARHGRGVAAQRLQGLLRSVMSRTASHA